MFWAVTLTENVDGDKYTYSGDSHPLFSFPNFDFGKNVIILGVDNSALLHIDKKEDILVLAEGPTQNQMIPR